MTEPSDASEQVTQNAAYYAVATNAIISHDSDYANIFRFIIVSGATEARPLTLNLRHSTSHHLYCIFICFLFMFRLVFIFFLWGSLRCCFNRVDNCNARLSSCSRRSIMTHDDIILHTTRVAWKIT